MKIKSFNTKYYLLVVILIAAAILRINHINQPFTDGISWRQADTATIADNFYRGNWNIFYPEVSWNGPGQNYVGYEFQTVTYIAAMLYRLFGQHDWVGRSVAVMFGLWGIFALYQLVRRVWDEQRAIATAAIMALLPGSIFIERSFLPDPVMVSLVVTSFWLLVAYLQTERLHYLLLASAIATWGLLTKISGIFVGIPMIYAMLTILSCKRMLRPKKLVLIGVAAVITLAVVIVYYLWARHVSLTYPPYHIAGSGNWLWNDGLANWLSQNYFLRRSIGHIKWMWTVPVLVLILIGLLFPPPKEKSDRQLVHDQPTNNLCKAPWLFHWWLLSGVIYYLIGAKELVDNPWNFHIINPAAAALAGHGIVATASFTTRIARSSAAIVLTIVLLLIVGTFGQKALEKYQYYSYTNESYKMGLALNQVSQPSDLVVTIAQQVGNPVAVYYSKRRGWVFPPAWQGVVWWKQTLEDDEAIRLFEELRERGADWLGIVNERKNELWNNNRTFIEYLQQSCELHQQSLEWTIYRILPKK